MLGSHRYTDDPRRSVAVTSSSGDLDGLAARAAGIISRRDLLESGWSSSGVKRAVRSGALVRIAAGVYRVRGAPWTRHASRHAAVAVAGPGAALSHWSAAELLRFADARPGPLQVVVPHSRRATGRAPGLVTVGRSQRLDPFDLVEVRSITATSPARTLLDIATDVTPARLAELATEAIRRSGLRVNDIEEILARTPRRSGRATLESALHLLGGDGHHARSMAEVAALTGLLAAGLPRPEVAHVVRGDDGHILAEVDLAYPAQRLAIEIDGYRWHSSPAQKLADEERQNRLVLAGWTVLRFSADVIRRTPDVLVEAVSRALRAS